MSKEQILEFMLKNENYVYLVMYSGSQIISAAHIEFLNETDAALRMLVSDSQFQSLGYNSQMMKLFEKWLKHKKVTTLKMNGFIH